jgi:hypothetical protein
LVVVVFFSQHLQQQQFTYLLFSDSKVRVCVEISSAKPSPGKLSVQSLSSTKHKPTYIDRKKMKTKKTWGGEEKKRKKKTCCCHNTHGRRR